MLELYIQRANRAVSQAASRITPIIGCSWFQGWMPRSWCIRHSECLDLADAKHWFPILTCFGRKSVQVLPWSRIYELLCGRIRDPHHSKLWCFTCFWSALIWWKQQVGTQTNFTFSLPSWLDVDGPEVFWHKTEMCSFPPNVNSFRVM